MSYPHIDDGLLQVFDNKDLIYLDERDEGCSIVVRLAPDTINGIAYPLRFEKRSRVIGGYIDNQVGHEENVFKAIKEQEQKGIYIKKNRQSY